MCRQELRKAENDDEALFLKVQIALKCLMRNQQKGGVVYAPRVVREKRDDDFVYSRPQ